MSLRKTRHLFPFCRSSAEVRAARLRQHQPESGAGISSMNDLIRNFDTPEDISAARAEFRQVVGAHEMTPNATLDVFEFWAAALGTPETAAIPGIAFLRLWLRRNTLEPIITRELGHGALHGNWMEDGRARLKAYPVGLVGHWPAGNIEIQPLLSMTCALLGGNT